MKNQNQKQITIVDLMADADKARDAYVAALNAGDATEFRGGGSAGMAYVAALKAGDATNKVKASAVWAKAVDALVASNAAGMDKHRRIAEFKVYMRGAAGAGVVFIGDHPDGGDDITARTITGAIKSATRRTLSIAARVKDDTIHNGIWVVVASREEAGGRFVFGDAAKTARRRKLLDNFFTKADIAHVRSDRATIAVALGGGGKIMVSTHEDGGHAVRVIYDETRELSEMLGEDGWRRPHIHFVAGTGAGILAYDCAERQDDQIVLPLRSGAEFEVWARRGRVLFVTESPAQSA